MRDTWNRDQAEPGAALARRRDDRNRGRATVGLVLMGVGAILLLTRLDLLPAHAMGRYWPLILLAVGLGKLLDPTERRAPGSALWLIFIGLWAEANVLHWFGLNWHNSWPLFLIFGGLCVLVSELSGKGESHDAQ